MAWLPNRTKTDLRFTVSKRNISATYFSSDIFRPLRSAPSKAEKPNWHLYTTTTEAPHWNRRRIRPDKIRLTPHLRFCFIAVFTLGGRLDVTRNSSYNGSNSFTNRSCKFYNSYKHVYMSTCRFLLIYMYVHM